MEKFYIRSTELRDYNEKHACFMLRVVDGNKILVNVSPPMPGYVYDRQQDIDRLVLAPRYMGTTLTPTVSEWPCLVNICLPKEDGGWENGPWRLLDIGEISR